MTLSDPYPRFQDHDIIQRQITQKMVQNRAILTIADQKIYRMVLFPVTLNEP